MNRRGDDDQGLELVGMCYYRMLHAQEGDGGRNGYRCHLPVPEHPLDRH